MNVLVVGGNGYVGSIFLPALDAEHTCHVLDLKFNPARTTRSFVGDACDPAVVAQTMMGMDCVIHCALGVHPLRPNEVDTLEQAFRAHVESTYITLQVAARMGVRRFVYVSSLSVYQRVGSRRDRIDETVPPDAWSPYGFTKRAGEYVCDATAKHYPQMSILSLRLMYPRNDADWPGNESKAGALWHPLGPRDTQALFAAAVKHDQPGHIAVQASGDLAQTMYPNHEVTRLLGWQPRGR